MLKIQVPARVANRNIKDFLRNDAGLSLTIWRKINHGGSLFINEKPATRDHDVHPGDIITACWSQPCSIKPLPMPLKICYEDDYLLVVDKPAGMLVHPVSLSNEPTLANGIMSYFQSTAQPYHIHPVQRLDRNTSGLILIAKQPHIQHRLIHSDKKNFKHIYLAVVKGIVDPGSHLIESPIARAPGSIILRQVSAAGQPAITKYRRLKKLRQASLIEVELYTGRTHQIRVHMSHIGHPLLGDDLYGGPVTNINRQALHAGKLLITHPVSEQPIVITSPLPADIDTLLKQLS